jgi:MSHA biogenesis protein MshO
VCSPNANGTGTLTRYYGYTPTAAQPNSVTVAPLSTASNALVLNDVSSCTYTPGTAQTDLNSMQINLQLTNKSESVTLYSQVITPNGP